MSGESLVSVILLTFNSSKYIGRALSSVYAQNYQNLEVIVVDAGSCDQTKNIVSSFAGVMWLDLPDSDMGMARNHGLNNSNGEYVMFLDSDDLYLEGKIDNQIKALEENKALDFVVSQAYVMKGYDKKIGIKDWTFDKLNLDSFLYGQCYSLATLCIRKQSLTQNCRFYEHDAGRYCEDWSFQFRLLLEGLTFDVLPCTSVLVELRNDSHTHWNIQPKMKAVGLSVVESAIATIKAQGIKCHSNKQDVIDNYKFKLAISYFANGLLSSGRGTLSLISGNFLAQRAILIPMSFILPTLLFSSCLRYLWSKQQRSTFQWTTMSTSMSEWIDEHNKHLN